jgi:hypothetical protein
VCAVARPVAMHVWTALDLRATRQDAIALQAAACSQFSAAAACSLAQRRAHTGVAGAGRLHLRAAVLTPDPSTPARPATRLQKQYWAEVRSGTDLERCNCRFGRSTCLTYRKATTRCCSQTMSSGCGAPTLEVTWRLSESEVGRDGGESAHENKPPGPAPQHLQVAWVTRRLRMYKYESSGT